MSLQSPDTAEKGGWGVPLTADPMKCVTYCSNPDLVQSQLSPHLQRNSPQLIPAWKSPCEVTLLWKSRLLARCLDALVFQWWQKCLWDPVLESYPEDTVEYAPASSVATPVRDLLQHLQIFVTSNLMESEGVKVLPGRPWCNWWQNMLFIYLQERGTHKRQMFHLNFSWAAEEAETRLNPHSQNGGLGAREVCQSFETGSWLPKAKAGHFQRNICLWGDGAGLGSTGPVGKRGDWEMLQMVYFPQWPGSVLLQKLWTECRVKKVSGFASWCLLKQASHGAGIPASLVHRWRVWLEPCACVLFSVLRGCHCQWTIEWHTGWEQRELPAWCMDPLSSRSTGN